MRHFVVFSTHKDGWTVEAVSADRETANELAGILSERYKTNCTVVAYEDSVPVERHI
jgi:hypothetical protein